MNERLTRDYEANLKAIRAGSWEPAIIGTLIAAAVGGILFLVFYALYKNNVLGQLALGMSVGTLTIVVVRQCIVWYHVRRLRKEFAVRAMTE